MKIGGSGELWLVIGPLLAVTMVATYVMGGPNEMIRFAERLTTDIWNSVLVTFRR
jgi:hypothetical protein